MIGHPQYNYNDIVRFRWNDGTINEGKIVVVDRYGTFEQDEEVSYDIRVPGVALFKHCRESWITDLIKSNSV